MDEKLMHLEASTEGHKTWLMRIETRLRSVEVRVAVYAALGSAVGTILTLGAHWLLKL